MCESDSSNQSIPWKIWSPLGISQCLAAFFCTVNELTLPCSCEKQKCHSQIQSTVLCSISIRLQENRTVLTCSFYFYPYLPLNQGKLFQVLTKSMPVKAQLDISGSPWAMTPKNDPSVPLRGSNAAMHF